MGVRIIVFREHGSQPYATDGALLWDSTTGYPLPLESFSTGDDAGDFLDWMDDRTDSKDLRTIPIEEVREAQKLWFKEHPQE